MTRRFAIDERSFDMTGMPANIVRPAITGLLDMMDELETAGHGTCYDVDMFQQPLWNGLTFWELFQEAGSGLTVPDQERAASLISHAVPWEDTGPPQPVSFDVYVNGGPPEVSGSLAWVYAQGSRRMDSTACISAPIKRAIGKYAVSINNAPAIELWFLDKPSALPDFFRDVITSHARSSEDIASLSKDAFPSLDFVDNSFNGIKQMSRPVSAIATDLVRHLAALSDHGADIFNGSWQDAPGRFGAYHVNISDENGNTKQNSVARKERTLVDKGVTREFWWHTKIEIDRDRIHIFPDLVADGGRIVVGIFCRHLTT